ncbi:MAG: hypothetical protein WC889_05425 [Myxococcota bacterium]|jgi:hypothetical protein
MSSKITMALLITALAALAVALVAGCPETNPDPGDAGIPDGGGTNKCTKTEDCVKLFGPDYTCSGNRCVKVATGCKVDADCPGSCCVETKCLTDATKCPKPCEDSTTCAYNEGCVDKICKSITIITCTDNAQCPVNFLCNKTSKKCECDPSNPNACKDPSWNEFTSPYCSPTKLKCEEEPTCDPACDDTCQDCVSGTCQFKQGIECCKDIDCQTGDPNARCVSNQCVAPTCTDTCATDEECVEWCGGSSKWYCQVGANVCVEAQCMDDSDCGQPTCSFKGTCDMVSKVCQCVDPILVCGLCKEDSDCDSGLTCTGLHSDGSTYCSKACTATDECSPGICGYLSKTCFCW